MQVTTAFVHNLPMFTIATDRCSLPDHDVVTIIESSWPEDQRSALTSHGISLQDVRAAFAYLQRLQAFELQRTAGGAEQEQVAIRVLETVFNGLTLSQAAAKSVPTARILVASCKRAETISACLVLQHMLQLKMQTEACCIFHSQELEEASHVMSVVFVMANGCLQDFDFCQTVLSTPGSLNRLVANDGTFDFPTPDFYRKIRSGELKLPGDPHHVAAAYQGLCSSLALPITPAGPSWLLDQQVEQMCHRLRSLYYQADSSTATRSFSQVQAKDWTWEEDEREENNAWEEDALAEHDVRESKVEGFVEEIF